MCHSTRALFNPAVWWLTKHRIAAARGALAHFVLCVSVCRLHAMLTSQSGPSWSSCERLGSVTCASVMESTAGCSCQACSQSSAKRQHRHADERLVGLCFSAVLFDRWLLRPFIGCDRGLTVALAVETTRSGCWQLCCFCIAQTPGQQLHGFHKHGWFWNWGQGVHGCVCVMPAA